QVVLNNQQISLNLKQQLDGIQQIVQAMETINQGAKETASGITQAKVGTQQLNETALNLKQLV
ncbi:chemotaxis protein, partial [Leptolyngbya sp. FACHB-671]|nr:chemotaxis protein [Leptolyngbya sp. FACHB-671]